MGNQSHRALSVEQRALRAVSVQFLINGAVAASYIPRLPEIRNALDVDLITIGQIITLASLGGLLGSLLAGRVMTKLGTRYAMIFGTIALIAVLPLIGLASTTTALLLILTILRTVYTAITP